MQASQATRRSSAGYSELFQAARQLLGQRFPAIARNPSLKHRLPPPMMPVRLFDPVDPVRLSIQGAE